MEGATVSVVVPTYYRNDRLRESLESVADQTYRPVETIVVDGSGESHARPVAEEFDCTYVAQERDEGPHAARSVGAERADGAYVQFLDDDDRLRPTKIETQVERLESEEGVGVVYCGLRDEEWGVITADHPIRGDALERALRLDTFPAIPSTMLVDADVLAGMLPNGDPLKFDVYAPPWHMWPTLSQVTVSQLEEFGFQIEHTVSGDVFVEQMWVDYDYAMARNSIKVAHPIMSLRRTFKRGNEFGVPETLDVPMPIGDFDGSTETINVADLSKELTTSSGDEYREKLRTLAWTFNYWLPMIPTNTPKWGMLYRVDEWGWPDHDDPVWAVDYQNRTLTSEAVMEPT